MLGGLASEYDHLDVEVSKKTTQDIQINFNEIKHDICLTS
jgi:hypothetical protein